ncbi:MAG TPA: cupin domain-containing protein [Nitrososphaerales archaeon]|nr:cupin domain-containing protein [Nitrososphaerales archaeon]
MPVIIDIEKSPRRDLPHGRGVTAVLFNPSNGAMNVDVHINTLNPGVREGAIHYHRKMENIYVILEGEGVIIDESGREYPVKAGQAVLLKPGEGVDTHEIYNYGSEPLRFVEIYAPAHPKEAYVGSSIDPEKRDHVVVKNTH